MQQIQTSCPQPPVSFQISVIDLQQLYKVFQEASIGNTQKQQQIYNQIQTLQQNPDFSNYLCYILLLPTDSNMPDLQFVRQIAGLTLKTAINLHFHNISPNTLQYIKDTLIYLFNDPIHNIRQTISILITTLVQKIGFTNWQYLLQYFSFSLSQSNKPLVMNTLDCMSKVIEDINANSENYSYLDSNEGEQTFGKIIPQLLSLTSPSQLDPQIKATAFYCLNYLVFSMPSPLIKNMPQFLDNLLIACDRQNANEVRVRALQGIQSLNETKRDFLMLRIQDVMRTTLEQLGSEPEGQANNEVSKCSISFWSEFMVQETNDDQNVINMAIPFIPELALKAMRGLMYTQEDIQNLQNKTEKQLTGAEIQCKNVLYEDDDNQDKENQNQNNIFDQNRYTLRSICGVTLERMARLFGEQIFQSLQQQIQINFDSENWVLQEMAITTLGTIINGEELYLKPIMDSLILKLINKINTTAYPAIIPTTLWTLSKFTNEICENEQYFREYLNIILLCLKMRDLMTQEAASSSFTLLMRGGARLITPLINNIFGVFAQMFANPSTNINSLLQAISSACDEVDSSAIDESSINMLMQPFFFKWTQLALPNEEICAFLECLVSICYAFKQKIKQQAIQFLPKLTELGTYYPNLLRNIGDRKQEFQYREIFIRVIDALSGMIGVLQPDFGTLLDPYNIFDLYLPVTLDKEMKSREFFYSFIGEVCSNAPDSFFPHIAQYYTPILESINMDSRLVDPSQSKLALCNNSCFTMGQMVTAYPQAMANCIFSIGDKIITVLKIGKLHKQLCQNLVRTLCKIGALQPLPLAERAAEFFNSVVITLLTIKESQEKRELIRGFFLMLIQGNQIKVVHANIGYFFKFLSQLDTNNDQALQQMVLIILGTLRNEIGSEAYQQLFMQFGSEINEQLRGMYLQVQ